MIRISICLTDIPKEKIKTSDSNGKKYVELIVDERRQADNYGNTHTVYVNPTKEERQAKADKNYVGNGKRLFDNTQNNSGTTETNNSAGKTTDDLPF